MNIRQAEKLTGISSQNIRFYEKEGLLHPQRNAENSYRDYTQEDVRTLKLIRIFRMVDMPLPQIRKVLAGEETPAQAAGTQEKQLEETARALQAAIGFCRLLSENGQDVGQLDADELLVQMEENGQEGYFSEWLSDYRKVAKKCHDQEFTFIPEEEVTDARSFTAALFAFAKERGADLVITREGMYPQFTLDGIEYEAQRYYTNTGGGGFCIPVATVHCHMLHPEQYPVQVPVRRKRLQVFLHVFLPWIAVYLLVAGRFLRFPMEKLSDQIAVLVFVTVVFGSLCAVNYHYYYNNRDHI